MIGEVGTVVPPFFVLRRWSSGRAPASEAGSDGSIPSRLAKKTPQRVFFYFTVFLGRRSMILRMMYIPKTLKIRGLSASFKNPMCAIPNIKAG